MRAIVVGMTAELQMVSWPLLSSAI